MYSSSAARKSVDNVSSSTANSRASEYPFPRQGSVGAHTPQRRTSTASSARTSLDGGSGSWGQAVLETGQNAISTLLQPPIVRTGLVAHTSASAFASAHKPPTARDIPPVTLTNIPHVDAAEFRPYLTQVGALYEQLRRVRENEDDGPSGLRRRGASRQDEVADLLDDNLKAGSVRSGGSAARKASIASLALLSSPIDAPSPVSRTGSGRRSTQGPPPLSTVPAVYFDEDFHLENPRIFDVVSERSEVVRKGPVVAADEKTGTSNGSAAAPRKALATNAILQEKLSWYMDTIEMHLISSISTASTTFFTALGSLRELHSEAADSVERIRTLRKELSALDEEIAARGLGILQKKRRRENLQQLNDAVVQLKMIVESVRSTEALVDAGEVEQALTSIDGLEQLIAGERSSAESGGPMPRLRDLRGATALQSVNGDLDTLRFRIGKAYESKFIGMLLSDLRRHSESVSTREVLLRWSSAAMRARGGHAREASAFPAYMGSVDELRSSLVPILTGLRRARHISVAASSYREAVLREIRNAIRRPLPSSSDDDNESMMSSSTLGGSGRLSQQEKSSILARNLRALEPEDAEELLVKIYVGITETLRRLTTQVKVLLDVASSMGQPALSSGMKSPPLRSPPPTNTAADADGLEMQEEIHKALDMANLLGQAVDVAQDKVVRILRVRAEQSKSLSLAWFLRYFTLNLYFANECEAISGRSGTALKTVVNGHIKDFVQQHGEAERQKLAAGMEADQWTAKDFSEQDTVLLNRILGCSTRDAAEWSSGSKIWLPYEDADANGPSAPAAADSNGTGRERVRPAIIDDEQYMLTQSAVLGLQGIARFLELACSIPSMTTDVSNSLIAYLHLFNSRCTQLILGAGATKSAGLKNINTRHLALASQALGFIATLIPHIREFARRHAGVGPPAATLMSDFDKVRRLYQEHQNSIYDKLVEIMSGRAVAQSKALKALIWDEEGPAGANAYMEVLVKDTITLHKVLQKLLPEGTVLMIMMPVFASYKDHFTRAYQSVDPKTAAGLARIRRDIEYFGAKLSKINGFGDTADALMAVVAQKESARAEREKREAAEREAAEKEAAAVLEKTREIQREIEAAKAAQAAEAAQAKEAEMKAKKDELAEKDKEKTEKKQEKAEEDKAESKEPSTTGAPSAETAGSGSNELANTASKRSGGPAKDARDAPAEATEDAADKKSEGD